jgi:hypothetical protein
MSTALTTRADLDAMPCEDCGETGQALYLPCPEHRDALSLPFYSEGELRLECGACGTIYLRAPVAG